MYKVYSFIEKDGKSLIPPEMKGENAPTPEYLMEYEGRHYMALSGKLPEQAPEIDLQGPIDLSNPDNAGLAEVLERDSYPAKNSRESRKRDYPELAEQIGAIMEEFAAREMAGEKLTPKLSALIGKIGEVKAKHPKKIKGVKE